MSVCRTLVARGALLALLVGVLGPAGASLIPASGPHETINLWTSTTKLSHSAAVGYRGRYHGAGDPDEDPPALRRLVIKLPKGTRIDTSAPPRCQASDSEIKLQGESACPPSARIGSGKATVKQIGFGVAVYPTVIYNAKDEQLELIKSGNQVLGIVHTYIHGVTLDGVIPTCLAGGQPPSGCPSDEVTLLSNHLHVDAFARGHGSNRRVYGKTPPTCPRDGRWKARVILTYATGAVDHVTSASPCSHRSLREVDSK